MAETQWIDLSGQFRWQDYSIVGADVPSRTVVPFAIVHVGYRDARTGTGLRLDTDKGVFMDFPSGKEVDDPSAVRGWLTDAAPEVASAIEIRRGHLASGLWAPEDSIVLSGFGSRSGRVEDSVIDLGGGPTGFQGFSPAVVWTQQQQGPLVLIDTSTSWKEALVDLATRLSQLLDPRALEFAQPLVELSGVLGSLPESGHDAAPAGRVAIMIAREPDRVYARMTPVRGSSPLGEGLNAFARFLTSIEKARDRKVAVVARARADWGQDEMAARPRRGGTKLFVGNLSFDTTSSDLESLFSKVGNVEAVDIITDRDTGRPRGFGFVEMGSQEDAARAIAELNGREVSGRAVNVSEAQQGPRGARGRGDRERGH